MKKLVKASVLVYFQCISFVCTFLYTFTKTQFLNTIKNKKNLHNRIFLFVAIKVLYAFTLSSYCRCTGLKMFKLKYT